MTAEEKVKQFFPDAFPARIVTNPDPNCVGKWIICSDAYDPDFLSDWRGPLPDSDEAWEALAKLAPGER